MLENTANQSVIPYAQAITESHSKMWGVQFILYLALIVEIFINCFDVSTFRTKESLKYKIIGNIIKIKCSSSKE